jgi:hypothetical protein
MMTNLINKECKVMLFGGIRKRVYPHLFRISGITNMYLNGVGLEDIRLQSRHADLEVILGYIQLIPEAKRKAYEKGMALGQENEKNIPQLTIKPEVQLTPQQPTIDNIKNKETELKVKQLELELANKQAEIELLRLRQQMNKTDNTNIYG